MKNMNAHMLLGLLAGMTTSMPAMAGYGNRLDKLLSAPRAPKNYPRMLTSTPEQIAAHNTVVTTRQVKRRAARPWKISKRWDA